MNLTEIKQAIDNNIVVHWKNSSYCVIKDTSGQYLIGFNNENYIGLTHKDGVTLNGQEEDFYINQ